ncbi:MAG: hypothetical protein KAI43_08730 [Candidatus Aureabacteria bacterium]|nr:hypothetical protein [Candidatus Auribacterota bacterium]
MKDIIPIIIVILIKWLLLRVLARRISGVELSYVKTIVIILITLFFAGIGGFLVHHFTGVPPFGEKDLKYLLVSLFIETICYGLLIKDPAIGRVGFVQGFKIAFYSYIVVIVVALLTFPIIMSFIT